MPIWLQAGAWGLLAGMALVVGAAIAWVARVPRRVVAAGQGVEHLPDPPRSVRAPSLPTRARTPAKGRPIEYGA